MQNCTDDKSILVVLKKSFSKNNQLTFVSVATFPPLLFVSMIRSDKKYKRNPNCCDDKSILTLLEQILLKICLEHPMGRANCGKLKKVSVRDKASSPQHSLCSYASRELIGIDFHPQTAQK